MGAWRGGDVVGGGDGRFATHKGQPYFSQAVVRGEGDTWPTTQLGLLIFRRGPNFMSRCRSGLTTFPYLFRRFCSGAHFVFGQICKVM